MGKEFSTIDDQIQKLKKRGLIINDCLQVKKTLEKENYYNLINGYKYLFIDKEYDGDDEKYIKDTNFNEIYQLYLFDRELRNLFIRYILEIENNFKSVIAHDFSEKYGHDNYLKITNFDTTINNKHKTTAQKYGDIADLISRLQREISTQLKKNNSMISHHILSYGYIPLWVLINTLSLGTVSKFYKYLKQQDQNDIGKIFRLRPNEMISLFSVLTIFRNACAHDERLFCLKAIKRDGRPNCIKTNYIHNDLNISKSESNNPLSGKNDLFAIVIIFKLVLDKQPFDNFYDNLYCLIESLDKHLNTISINNVLKEMGFPCNWNEIKNICKLI